MSGRLFVVAPSKYERDNVREIRELVREAKETGHLPSTPVTEMWERRFDLNPLRFGFNHPNLRIFMQEFSIDRDSPYLHPPQPPVYADPPANPPDTGCTTCEPCPQVVPEPEAIVMLGAALGLIAFAMQCQKKWKERKRSLAK